ncbi:hypothetical protein Pmani_039515 [Petrolisthes manimaculis]|uniref:Uncharacterized protein n=1 Tax=Petrolisthes manimaculis TaxID=1843537 RepID=A0AAE1NEZ6_9EUCA|nr:hypothetical protein Pmani_039515 [Petrolisthes manimaculis]
MEGVPRPFHARLTVSGGGVGPQGQYTQAAASSTPSGNTPTPQTASPSQRRAPWRASPRDSRDESGRVVVPRITGFGLQM